MLLSTENRRIARMVRLWDNSPCRRRVFIHRGYSRLAASLDSSIDLASSKELLNPEEMAEVLVTMAREEPRWARVQMLASMPHGRLWQQVAQRLEGAADGATFWQLSTIHGATVGWMPAQTIWSHLRIPVLRDSNDANWQRFAAIGALYALDEDDSFALVTERDNRVGFPDEVKKWGRAARGDEPEWLLSNAILNLSIISVEGDAVRVAPREPDYPDRAPWEIAL